MMRLERLVTFKNENVIADVRFQQDIDDARRWTRDMGRTARVPR
jgi:hypothetical protein